MENQSKRIALVTGGSSGLGLELAGQMAAQGATVIVCGRSRPRLEEARKRFPQLTAMACDVTLAGEREALGRFITAEFPGLNMLVNNAGIVRRFRIAATERLEENLSAEWQTNYLAPVALARQFLPLLAQNHGTLVNVTSGLAYLPLAIEPNYCATKAALHSMTQSMRVQFASLGVRVVEILYPAVDTPFQGGHAPRHAIQAGEAAAIALRGLNRGREEIRVKKAGLIHAMSRLMPDLAFRMLNRAIPESAWEQAARD